MPRIFEHGPAKRRVNDQEKINNARPRDPTIVCCCVNTYSCLLLKPGMGAVLGSLDCSILLLEPNPKCETLSPIPLETDV